MKRTILLVLLTTASTALADSFPHGLMRLEYSAIVTQVENQRPREIDPPLILDLEMLVEDQSKILRLEGSVTGMNPYDIPGARDSITFDLDSVNQAWFCGIGLPCSGGLRSQHWLARNA